MIWNVFLSTVDLVSAHFASFILSKTFETFKHFIDYFGVLLRNYLGIHGVQSLGSVKIHVFVHVKLHSG